MKRVSKALHDKSSKDWDFYSALTQRPAIDVQHFQARRQKGNPINNRMKALPSN